MTLRQYLVIMFLGTLLCWAAWGLVVLNIDPFVATLSAYVFFYTSLFLALFGSIALIIFLLLVVFRKESNPLHRLVRKSFLFGLYISLITVFLLVLQAQRFLQVWNVTVLGGLVLFISLFWWSTARPRRRLS
ncbi:MAG: hypothetical protein ABII02_02990 [Candidatus Magasanikbacteria bacterium]